MAVNSFVIRRGVWIRSRRKLIMPKKLTYEEKFEKFKNRFQNSWLDDFRLFCKMSDEWQEIKIGLIKEKKEQFKDND